MLVKAIINKSGSGSTNVRVPIPSKIAKEFNINAENKDLEIYVEGEKIIITKIREAE